MKFSAWFVPLGLVFVVHLHNPAHARKVLRERPLYLRVRYAGACETDPGDIATNLTLQNIGKISVVNGNATALRRIEKILQTVVTIRRCQSQAEDKNCEHFQTWRFGKESCTLLEQKGQLWSPMFQGYHPPLKCPIPKRFYRVVNSTLDLSSIINIFGSELLEKNFWRWRMSVYDDRLFGNICFGFGILRGRH